MSLIREYITAGMIAGAAVGFLGGCSSSGCAAKYQMYSKTENAASTYIQTKPIISLFTPEGWESHGRKLAWTFLATGTLSIVGGLAGLLIGGSDRKK